MIPFTAPGQSYLNIMPLGNSITFDTYSGDARPDAQKSSYRYQLYTLLQSQGYTFDFVGSEKSGGAYLPTTPPDYSDNAGFPGYTANQILNLLQTGFNRDGVCEIGTCPGSYLTHYQPDVILLHLGTNGLNSNSDADNIILNIEDILNEIDNYESTSGKEVVVFLARIVNRAGPNPAGNDPVTSYYNGLIENLAAARTSDKLVVVDMESGASINYNYTADGGDMYDLLHPAPSGYSKMGTLWNTEIESYNLAPPEVSDIPNDTENEGGSFTVSLDNFVFDPQEPDEAINWTASGNVNLNVNIAPSTRVATISASDVNWYGTEVITFMASDPFGATSSDAVSFTLLAINDTPEVSDIPSQQVNEGQPFASFNLDDFVADVDHPDNQLIWASSGSTDLSVNIDGNRVVTVTAPSPGWSGSETILFTATDPGAAQDSDAATFTKLAVNEAPDVTDIPDQTIAEGASFATINLDGFVSDPDNAPNEMTWTASGNTLLSVSIVNRVATITIPSPDWYGSETITFTATDPGGEDDSDAASFTVTNVNDNPVLSAIEASALSYDEGDGPVDITNTILVADIDNSQLTSAAITISANYLSAEDRLDYSNALGISGSWNGTTGELTLSGTATLANYQAALRNVSYENISASPSTATRTVQFRVYDGQAFSNGISRNIAVGSTNSAPVLADPSSTVVSFTEGIMPVQISNTIAVSDDDNPTLASASVSISSGFVSSQDVLSFTSSGGISGSFNTSTGQLSLSGNASPAAYQTVLRSVRFANTSENPTTGNRTISFTVNDGLALSNTINRTVSVTAVNDPPLLGGIEIPDLSYSEGSGPVQITNAVTITDVDDLNIETATITISNNFRNTEDVLLFTNANGISGSWNSATGIMLLSGTSSVANYQAALRNVRYENTSSDPDASDRTITFQANDGENSSNNQSRIIAISISNTPPVLTQPNGSPLAYTEDDPATVVAGTLTVTDADNPTLVSALVSISAGYQSGQDLLSYTPSGGISGLWNSTNGTLALSGSASPAAYQTVLRTVRYANGSQNPSVVTRTITFTANDGSSSSEPVSRNVNVTRTNNPPDIQNIPATVLPFTEDGPAVTIANALTIIDPDNTRLDSAIVRITTNYTPSEDSLRFKDVYPGLTAFWRTPRQITLKGLELRSVYETAMRTVQYYNYDTVSPATQTRTIRFTAYDSAGLASANVTRQVSVTAVNDPPRAATVSFSPATNVIGVPYTASFSYSDPEGNPAGTHQYKWYRATVSNGVDAIAIPGATAATYTPVAADGGRYLCTEVTPVDNQGGIGLPVKSAFRLMNEIPVASGVTIFASSLAVGQDVIGKFTYSDKENDQPGNHAYQWYSNNNPSGNGTLISSATDTIYRLRAADENRYIRFVITPAALTGSSPGESATSGWIGPIGSNRPTATLSGSDTICQGGAPAVLTVTLTGTPKWTIVYRRTHPGGTVENTVRYIATSPYTFNAPGEGTYTLISVADTNYTSGSVSGQAIVGVYPKVQAVMGAGPGSICNDGTSTATIPVSLTGTAPWSVTVRRGLSNDTTYTNIATSTLNIAGRVIGIPPTTYRIIALSDAHCPGDTIGSGTARVAYKASPRAIIAGTDSVCGTDPASLQVTFPEGTAPWSITYLRNATNPTVVNGINTASYVLQVSGAGTYTLSRVQDAVCTGKVSGSGLVVPFSSASAVISGSATICEHTTANLNVALTGKSPWKFKYRRNTESPVEVLNVDASPDQIPVKLPGTYTLVEVYDRNCKGTVSGNAVITQLPAPDVALTGLAPAYNLQTNWIPVFGNPGGGSFTGPALFPVRDTMFFFPSIAGLGTHEIIYSYPDPGNSCFGYDTAVVRVLTANADISFPEEKKFYCFNDGSFVVTGLNTAGDTGSFTISGGEGLTDHGNNTATIYPQLLSPGVYEITYIYFDQTQLTVKESFNIGNKPDADFGWESECYHSGQSIHFKDKSVANEGSITAFKWLFLKSTGYDSLETKDTEYTYSEAGNHLIELQVTTSNGCKDTLRKLFSLRPTIPLGGVTYEEDFESSPISWTSGITGDALKNSWKMGDPINGFPGAESGLYCWYTHVELANPPLEQSYVSSPCFDFTGTIKPLLVFNIYRKFNSTTPRDGAVLQATADSGKTWVNVGKVDGGINWFNNYEIFGRPGGNQNIGWAIIRDTEWQEARHSLDAYKGKKEVQFRFAYGSDGTAFNTNGLAFDNFSIRERNRTVLLEHFTNASDEDSKLANVQLNSLVNADSLNLLDIQYHTSYPGSDPFNADNPFVPSTRALYYGLSSVPYTLLSGGFTSDRRFDYDALELEEKRIKTEYLSDSKFYLNGRSEFRDNNQLHIEIQVAARENIPLSEITLHIAVIEERITGITGENGEKVFESVVKDLVPDAAGTTLYRSWEKNVPVEIIENWQIADVYDPQQLRVVTFLQDEITGEIYQADLDTAGQFLSVEDLFAGPGANNHFALYPNPAGEETHLRLKEPAQEDLVIDVFNNLGAFVLSVNLEPNTAEKLMNVSALPAGLYMVRLRKNNIMLGTAKLAVTRTR